MSSLTAAPDRSWKARCPLGSCSTVNPAGYRRSKPALFPTASGKRKRA